MQVHISKFSPDVIAKYNLNEKADKNGYIYITIKKGMYGLKPVSILAQQQLVKIQEPHGYYHELYSVGLWSHQT